MKEQIKQFFKKEWLNVTMYSVITLLLFCCMFWEPMVYVTVVAMVVFCAFRPVQHTFYMIFFAYAFLMATKVTIFNMNLSLYYIFFIFAISIIGVKYLTCVFLKRKSFNFLLFILSSAFILYCFLPIGPYNKLQHMQLVGIVAGLYLCYEFKTEISFKNLVYIASLGLIVSSLFSFVAFNSSRMLNILTQYTNYGYIKFQGLFGNPNNFSIYQIIILPCLLLLYVQSHKWYTLCLFMINFTFAYMTLSRNFIMCLAVMLVIYVILEIIYFKKNGLFHVGYVMLGVLALCAVMFTSTKIYLVRFHILPESSIVYTQEDVNAAVVIPSVPAEPNISKNPLNDETFVDDPGREGLWERYWQDYTSSWQIILFGRGLAYPLLGNIDAHQGFLKIFWSFGIVGVFLLLILIIYYLKNLFKNKNFILMLLFLPFVVACFVENTMFNTWTFLFLVVLILQFKESFAEVGEI